MKKTTETPQENAAEPETEPSLNALLAENAELKMAIGVAAAREQIVTSLERVGARSPLLLFDAAKGHLQFAEDGTPSNTHEIVDRLQTQFPEQFGLADPPPSINAAAGRATNQVLTKATLSKMSAAEIAKLDWADVRSVLSSDQ